MKIVAVVVTYNRLELLKQNIEALQGQTIRDLSVLVVDNHSSDGTHIWLNDKVAENSNPIKIYKLTLEENLGGAGGFYYGMRHATEKMQADALWIMDDDTIPKPDALEKLWQAYEVAESHGEKIGYLASVVLWKDGTPCKMNVPKFLASKKQRKEQGDISKATGSNLLAISQATFVSLFIPRDVVEQVGYPIKEYFIWGDDKEYTLRISDAYPCYQVTDSVAWHRTKTNEGSSIAKDDIERVDRYFYAYRNDYVTAKRRSKNEVLIYHLAFWLNEMRIILYSDHKKKRLEVMRSGRTAGRKLCEQGIPF